MYRLYENCKCSIQIRDLCVKNNNKLILKSISFSVNHGEIFALIGKNGSGKTTLLKSILGITNYSGKIIFFNYKGDKIFNPKIGYVPQKLSVDKNMPITVLDFFCLGLTKFPVWFGCKKKITERIEKNLSHCNSKHLLKKTIGSLSGGELQRVLLTFALEPKPDILLLDEPSSALDGEGIDYFYSLINSLKSDFHMPIILVSHDLDRVKKYSNKFALIENGILIKNDLTSRLCFKDMKSFRAVHTK
ncbi:MAG: zinc ABC transporter ATP-binding protein [Candidatus Improbicoccus pseudotrichonymphae]|uniref:Zinc ABC transporter ATP-binding protein n=1 Tax=Candidatus Improbicoccus pseudotrichonymphae TaxID=3033792 RepID=A0AA48HXW3_9FIRM|nr:MAG: zinc ABC transporter ATP-binding protein [Candidatus Improbicoccus pseudotrichonymphae]